MPRHAIIGQRVWQWWTFTL